MYKPEDRYWEVVTYLELEKVIQKKKQRIKKLEEENKKLREELEKVRQSE